MTHDQMTAVSMKLTKDILECVCADRVGITAAFDGWINIKQKHLFGVVLITSQSISLIWNACNISNLQSKTENDNNEDFAQESEESSVSNNETCSPTTNNSPSEVAKVTETTKVTEVTKMTKVTEGDIADEAKTSDEEEDWSNIIEN
ncbi:3035_t:CDS:2 [Racocetra persica]|uniref:3035_t:CDS:1 n=1 Tax=Racocetra persica TaxID=160502 RepID=A0ACA9KHU3_9GLOM|nr:3035_t:CDS:2 [Racocetra persica]